MCYNKNMLIHKIIVGPIQTNCYIVSDGETGEVLIIDPGDEAKKIIEFIELRHFTPIGVVLTHDHFDHIEALDEVIKYFNILLFDTKIQGEITISVGKLNLKVIKTPGHSKDSICLVSEKNNTIFSGDTLFNQGIGRTDLEGGDPTQIKESLKLLMTYPDDYKVYPGHGAETTIGNERQNNPHLNNL